MDDSHVSVVHNEANVVSQAAYVLFYKRRSIPSLAPPTEVRFDLDSASDPEEYETPEEGVPTSLTLDNIVSGLEGTDALPNDDQWQYADDDNESNKAEPSSPPSLDMDDLDHSPDLIPEDSLAAGDSPLFPTSDLGYTDMDDID